MGSNCTTQSIFYTNNSRSYTKLNRDYPTRIDVLTWNEFLFLLQMEFIWNGKLWSSMGNRLVEVLRMESKFPLFRGTIPTWIFLERNLPSRIQPCFDYVFFLLFVSDLFFFFCLTSDWMGFQIYLTFYATFKSFRFTLCAKIVFQVKWLLVNDYYQGWI